LQPLAYVISRRSFDDIRSDGVSGAARLRAQFEPLVGGPRFDRQPVQLNEKVVGSLPRDQRVVS